MISYHGINMHKYAVICLAEVFQPVQDNTDWYRLTLGGTLKLNKPSD